MTVIYSTNDSHDNSYKTVVTPVKLQQLFNCRHDCHNNYPEKDTAGYNVINPVNSALVYLQSPCITLLSRFNNVIIQEKRNDCLKK